MLIRSDVKKIFGGAMWLAVGLVGVQAVVGQRDSARRIDGLLQSVQVERQQAAMLLGKAYKAAGQRIALPDALMRIHTWGGVAEPLPPGRKVIAVLAENACGDCHDRELSYLAVTASKATHGHVLVVVVSNQARYAEALGRRAAQGIMVFWDPEAAVAGALGTGDEQVTALLDDDDRLVAVNVPLTGAGELSIPFHDRAFQFLSEPLVSTKE